MNVSLIRRGPHTVTVTPRERVQGSLGTTVVDGEPVTLRRVTVQSVSSSEVRDMGLTTEVVYKVIGTGSWPGGPLSRVSVDVGPHPGEYDQQGEAVYHNMNPRTAHWVVRISRRGTEVK